MKGDSPTSGEVKLVNAVDGGAEPSGSLKMSFGDTVRVDPIDEAGLLMDVKAVVEKSKDMSFAAKAGPRPAPMLESNELLLFRSAGRVSFACARARRRKWSLPAMFTTLLCCGMLLLELENKGTGGRCCN